MKMGRFILTDFTLRRMAMNVHTHRDPRIRPNHPEVRVARLKEHVPAIDVDIMRAHLVVDSFIGEQRAFPSIVLSGRSAERAACSYPPRPPLR